MRSSPRFWRGCRILFRWFRITVWLLVLTLICIFLWFNRIGLPDFVKDRILAACRERGIELEFSHIRLRSTQGLVAENVRLGGPKIPDEPTVSIRELQLHFNYRALLHRKVEVTGVLIRNGKLTVPLTETNGTATDLAVGNIQTELRFGPKDSWLLDNFKADFAGVNVALTGQIVHGPEMRNWGTFKHRKSGNGGLRKQLQTISDTLEKIKFTGTPAINGYISGDARDVHSFIVRVVIRTDAVQSPWASAADVQLTANVSAPADVQTNGVPAAFADIAPFRVVLDARVRNLKSKKISADAAGVTAVWQAPQLTVTNFFAALGGGTLHADASLNMISRRLAFTNSSDFDLHAVSGLLTEKARKHLEDFTWTHPPRLQGAGSMVLPDWTNHAPDWKRDIEPSVKLSGWLAFTNATVHGAVIDSVSSHFSYKDLLWLLPDLKITQGRTRLVLNGGESEETKRYGWRIDGAFDPQTVRPFLTTSNAVRGFNHVQFTQPVAFGLNVRGKLYDYDSISAEGHLTATNFAVREQHVDAVAGDFTYSNRVLQFINPHISRGKEAMTADCITLDLSRKIIYFTNGFSTADPQAVAEAIGPKIGRHMKLYQFLQAPKVRVHGQVPLRDINHFRDAADADLSFDVIEKAPLQIGKIRTPGVQGTVRWLAGSLILTNVTADVYGGGGNGWAVFDFSPEHPGSDYQAFLHVTNVDLHLMAMDWRTNSHLEGQLRGTVTITNASSESPATINGFGNVNVRDGLFWDIPIFGFLSPVLNSISPGLGYSRATSAVTHFQITNGVVSTDSLEIRATMMRMDYMGTVDWQTHVNARVTAQFLRDTWVVGPLLSRVLWPVSKLFEFQVTGTLKHPETKPLYLPSLFMVPLHPIRSVEKAFDTGTNAPPSGE